MKREDIISIDEDDTVEKLLSRSPSPPDTIYQLVRINNETYAVKVIPNTVHGGMTTTAPPFYIEITEDAAEEIMSNKDMALKRMRDIELGAV